ncbi:helix-turn-helix domain-containing protein [Streptomyces cupreus]|uniref:Helix-turn-helix domain-containing protein n=1 Tax=Streptomyces cupreus TaxID=2759956 RepID=A0A7X1J2W5_9ACTN|nr:helix-turn-helix domain-containing protein [Streptomyces cupreus]MBC2903210.1 helix-turn-helix domain-containing protein [Streptomyces cupreus]
MATRDLGRLARRVKAHRLELFSSRLAAARAAGISKDTWQRVEEGEEVRESTYAKIDRVLGWAVGSCILIAAGGEPVLADEAPAAAAVAPRLSEEDVREAAYKAAMAKLPDAPIGAVQAFAEELVKVLRSTGAMEDDA